MKRREYIRHIHDNASKKMDLPKVGHLETEFLQFQHFLASKMDPFELIITCEDKFPFRIFDSKFLKKALDAFNFKEKTEEIIEKLVETKLLRKAFMYLFWIHFGLRF